MDHGADIVDTLVNVKDIIFDDLIANLSVIDKMTATDNKIMAACWRK